MGRFLRDHWPWILAPIVLVLVLLVLLVLFGGGGGDASPHIYEL